MLPTLERVAPRVVEAPARTGAEDFAFYQERIPGFYLWLGVRSPGVAEAEAAPNHSPRFLVDEAALPVGVRVLSSLALDYLSGSRIPAAQ
jgi:metal-dependent amidase/aminoacylase/carboxypeptidase family protein